MKALDRSAFSRNLAGAAVDSTARRERAELGTIEVGKPAGIVVWPADPICSRAHTDPVEAWLRCGSFSARSTIVDGSVIVEDGALAVPGLAERARPRPHRAGVVGGPPALRT